MEHRTISLIKESPNLPQIPESFGKILNMLLDPYEFDMDKCIEEFSNYPLLETALIDFLTFHTKLNRKDVTIRDAIVYLGAKNTKTIAIAYITKLLLPNKIGRAKIFDNKKYWKHCLGTSIAAYLIAAKTKLSDKDKLFTLGLIHDIGVTILDICLPEELDQIHTLQLKGLHQIAAERVVLKGITHAEIGMWFCREWGLPDEIVEVVGFHHMPFRSNQAVTDVKIMHLADAISTSYYETLLGYSSNFIYSTRVMESLEVRKDFVDEIRIMLPQEVQKVERLAHFEF